MDHQLDVRVARSRRLTARADRVAVAAAGVTEADASELDRLRAADHRNLRHADEQTVLALAAVRQAANQARLGSFDDWGVIVAPRWQGRLSAATTVARFRAVGARGVGPQVIPNLCLHAPAATVSLAITARGPVYGVGGGSGHLADGLLAALAAQLGRDTPGTWIALSEWHGDESDGSGRAVALALVPDVMAEARWQLTFRPHPPDPPSPKGNGGELSRTLESSPPSPLGKGAGGLGSAPADLSALVDFLTRPAGWRWDCPP